MPKQCPNCRGWGRLFLDTTVRYGDGRPVRHEKVEPVNCEACNGTGWASLPDSPARQGTPPIMEREDSAGAA